MNYKTISENKLNDAFLFDKRFASDTKANELVIKIFNSDDPSKILSLIASIQRNSAPLPPDLPDYLMNYFNEKIEIDQWISHRYLKISSDFFEQNGQHVFMCLMLLSLPYCYAAAVDAEVLIMSKRLKNDTEKRLIETAQFVIDVMSADAFEPLGRGIRSIQKVRLMHAVVRYHLKKKDIWDISKGLPINQEAMAGTNLAFSLIILRGLQKLNISISADQEKAYMLRWNLIGSIMGIDHDLLFEDIKNSIWLEKRIRSRHFRKSIQGLELTHSLVETASKLYPDKPLNEFLYPIMSYLLGEEVAEILEIPFSRSNTELINLLKLKNTFDQAFAIKSGNISLATKNEMNQKLGGTVDFKSSIEL